MTKAALTSIEEDDSRLAYVGTWKASASSSASGGSFFYTGTTPSSALVAFSGTDLRYVATTGPTFGLARLTLDGGSPVYVDLYSSSTRYRRIVWSAFGLGAGNHVLRIEWTGKKNSRASGTAVDVDALLVAEPLNLASVVSTTTTTSASTTTTITAPSTTTTTVASTTTTTAPSTGKTYYVDATSGNDANDGASSGRPWKTVAKVHDTTFAAGDTILFKRGEVWRESLYLDKSSGSAGKPITFGAYGTGAKPLFLGSVDLSSTSSWTATGGNVWRSASVSMPAHCYNNDVGTLVFNNEASLGSKKSSQGAVTTQGAFYYDPSTHYVYLYSVGNPGTFYAHIEAGRTWIGLCLTSEADRKYFTVRDITFKYWAYHGADISGENIILDSCDFELCSGGYQGGSQDGNGIMVELARNSVIRYCHIRECWESGISIQVMGGTAPQISNLDIYGNTIENSNKSYFDTWANVTAGITNLRIFNNTCYGLGDGLFHAQRGGVHRGLDLRQNFSYSNCIFKNNIFYNPRADYNAVLWVDGHGTIEDWDIDYNCYYNTSPKFDWQWTTDYDLAGWVAKTAAEGHPQEAHSTVSDPLFNNGAGGDYTLKSGSPCRGLGAAIPGVTGSSPDLGARF